MNSLSSKIGLGYFVVIAINILIAVFAVYHINRISEPLDQILKENYRNINSAEQMRHAITAQEIAHLTMLENSIDSSLINNFNSFKNDFLNWHENAVNGISLPREPIILDSLKMLFAVYLLKSDSLHILLDQNTPYHEVKIFHFGTILPLATELSALCGRLKEINEQAIFNADNKAKGISLQANILITTFSFIGILISIIAGVYFTRRIIQPVKKTTDTVRKIRRGQFNQKIAITTNDEIAELGIEFNRMTDRLDKHVRDVSGLKKLDQLKSDFMSTISHEFKTPLTSINLAIDILLNEKQGQINETQKELLIQTKEDCKRLLEFAKDLLDLSKLESGTTLINFETINIKDFLDYSLQSYKNILTKKDIQPIITIDPIELKCNADKKHLARVLSNLLDNAINHSDNSSKIEISVIQDKDNIRFSVSDHGSGIPSQSLEQVFDKFIQVGIGKGKGNIGLGLAICKEVIAMHNGSIWIESELGKGSNFIFTIPR